MDTLTATGASETWRDAEQQQDRASTSMYGKGVAIARDEPGEGLQFQADSMLNFWLDFADFMMDIWWFPVVSVQRLSVQVQQFINFVAYFLV